MLSLDEHNALGRDTCRLWSLWIALQCMMQRVYGKRARITSLLREWYKQHQALKQVLDELVCRESPHTDGRCLKMYFDNYPDDFNNEPAVQFLRDPEYGVSPGQRHSSVLTPEQLAILELVRTDTRAYLARIHTHYIEHYRSERELATALARVDRVLAEIDLFATTIVVV